MRLLVTAHPQSESRESEFWYSACFLLLFLVISPGLWAMEWCCLNSGLAFPPPNISCFCPSFLVSPLLAICTQRWGANSCHSALWLQPLPPAFCPCLFLTPGIEAKHHRQLSSSFQSPLPSHTLDPHTCLHPLLCPCPLHPFTYKGRISLPWIPSWLEHQKRSCMELNTDIFPSRWDTMLSLSSVSLCFISEPLVLCVHGGVLTDQFTLRFYPSWDLALAMFLRMLLLIDCYPVTDCQYPNLALLISYFPCQSNLPSLMDKKLLSSAFSTLSNTSHVLITVYWANSTCERITIIAITFIVPTLNML